MKIGLKTEYFHVSFVLSFKSRSDLTIAASAMKFGKSKKSQPSDREKKNIPREKPARVITAQGWKNYLKKKYFSKK